jgi:hypothetical protein
MAFSIDNYDELMALHRTLMEAKFSKDPNDRVIQGSALVSNIANRVVEELTEMDIAREGEKGRLKWQEWRRISPERREYQIIQAKLKSESLSSLSSTEQVKYVKDLFSPLQVSDELIDKLLA